jgi:molybdopterin synthase catalytic subunit/molybdopterin converting factor small subunit
MKVQVHLFARFRELAGVEHQELELAAGASARDAWNALRVRHPLLPADPAGLRPARNEEFSAWEDPVAEGDDLAFIPPVSGGGAVLIEITVEPLDARRLEAAVSHPGAGAICSFTGIVRDFSRGESVTHLEYEAYAGMAERQMEKIADEISERWPGTRVAMAHRTGRLEVGEASVVVSTSAAHRGEAIAACKWGIDRLKESVPIWKKEFAASGATWIEESGG